MAYRLSVSREDYATTTAVASELESFGTTLDTLSRTYDNALADISQQMSIVDNASGSWGDEVGATFTSFCGELSQSMTNLDADLKDNFKSMRSRVSSITSSLNSLATDQKDYVEWINSEPDKTIQQTIYKDDKGNVSTYHKEGYDNTSTRNIHNPRWTEWNALKEQQEDNIDTQIGNINSSFAILSSYTFGKESPEQAAARKAALEEAAAEEEFVPVDDVTVAGEDVDEAAAMAAGLATASNEDVTSDVQINPGDYVDKDGNVYNSKGGEDGHHYSSREDAINVLLTTAPDVYRTEADAAKVVDEYIKNGKIILPPVDGMQNYTENRHTEQEFIGKDGDTATRTEDLTITGGAVTGEDGKVNPIDPHHGEGTAHYVTTDGEKYTGDITIDYSHQGASFQKDERITKDSTGEQVAQVGTHQVIDYKDSTTGSNVNVTDREIQQGDMVMGTRDMKYEYGEGQQHVVSSQWSYKQPAEGQPITEGTYVKDDYGVTHTYTYSYNEKGQLIETDSYYNPGGLFGLGKGDHNDTRVVDTSEVYTLKVTNPDGTTTSTPILMDSEMGFAELARQYENARMDVGYKADYAREGMHFLTMGNGDPVEVSGYSSDDTYTFELIPPEN